MAKILKHYFVPHAQNNWLPHILQARRTVFYSAVFLAMKLIVIGFVLLIPAEAYLLPDVLAGQARTLFSLTNDLRRERALPLLQGEVLLERSATVRAADMAENGYFSHEGPGQRTLAYFLRLVGYNYRVAGENLAMGFPDAESLFAAWVASPSHYANLVDRDYRQFGVGLQGGAFNGQPTVYVVEHFGDPAAALAEVPPARPLARAPRPAPRGRVVARPAPEPAAVQGEKLTPLLMPERPATPLARYVQGRRALSPLTHLFTVARIIYLGAIIFFSAALLLTIFIEIRRQHYHVIAQTLGLLCLLLVLWYV